MPVNRFSMLVATLVFTALMVWEGASADASLTLGVAVPVKNFLGIEKFRDCVVHHFNVVVPENAMKLRKLAEFNKSRECRFMGISPESRAKDFVEAARRKGLQVHGHAWIWHTDFKDGARDLWGKETIECLQQIKSRQSDEEIAALLDAYVPAVASTFRGELASVDVVNEALCGGDEHCDSEGLRSVEQNPWARAGRQYIARAFEMARKADARPIRYYNDYDLWTSRAKRCRLKKLVGSINTKQNGQLIQGIGLQMHIKGCLDNAKKLSKCGKTPTEIARKVREALSDLVGLGLKLRISELEIKYPKPFTGYEDRQAKQYAAVIRTYLDTVPEAQRGGITLWKLRDAECCGTPNGCTGTQHCSHLFRHNLTAKPAYFAVQKALGQDKEPCLTASSTKQKRDEAEK